MLSLPLKNRIIKTELPAFVMGIVNVTPDSLFKNSRGGVERALQLVEEGADILDVGAESTRPGSQYVSEEEELSRLIPVIEKIRAESDIPISVDTRKKNVMKAALDAGADILNDISALEDDAEMASFCAEEKIPVILMHKKGLPVSMQDHAVSEGAFEIVNTYLKERADYAVSKGIAPEKIIVDPGIGFGKDLKANVELIKNTGNLCDKKYPILMALSRKTCIGEMTGRAVEDRLYGTLCADILSVMKGASMVRVHDVKETVDTLKVLRYINS